MGLKVKKFVWLCLAGVWYYFALEAVSREDWVAVAPITATIIFCVAIAYGDIIAPGDGDG